MGCMHSKSSAVDDIQESGFKGKDRSRDLSLIQMDIHENGSRRVYDVDGREMERKISLFEKQRNERAESLAAINSRNPTPVRVPKAAEGEQVAAGWPSWLSAVAGEAINGWLPRRADTFEKLDKIGQGTYSSVYRARDLISNKIVALKRVRFDNLDPESVKFMCREILILRKLDHQNIIKLEGLITSRLSRSLHLVFEYMEHDLAGLAARPGEKFTEPQIKCYMKQLLSGLDHCHRQGILHRDIKGSNLLIDNNGILKIADFGLASLFDPDCSIPLTSRVVTLWYRPPELLLGASHYGVEVDLWSTGCILGELYTGRPILPGKTEVEQLHKIFKLCGSPSDDYWRNLHLSHAAVFRLPQHYRKCIMDTFKELPPVAIGLIEKLLSVDPSHRGTAALALNNEFFTTSPTACDPSCLPKYPPSKEIDAKLREEEAGIKRNSGRKNQGSASKLPPDPRSNPGYNNANEEQMQMSQSRGEAFSSQQDKTVSGFLVGPLKEQRGSKEPRKYQIEHYQKPASYSGPLIPVYGIGKAPKDLDHCGTITARSRLSTHSGLLARRTGYGNHESSGASVPSSTNKVGRFSRPIHGMEPHMRRQDSKYHSKRNSDTGPVEDGRIQTKESALHYREPEGNKMYLSGPLLVPSNNVDQLLKEHDRRIQEYSRRTRVTKYQTSKRYVYRKVLG
ncbi:hypothetical protein SAY87_001395 [Trapa incisa]|uniref:Protein kinase domain-containing protein n=1 Tax=Trapa incisa TaxID=236973 RepID=A0AAN7JGX6_9MYRT|nr:hypothetical protein SAY87_001395 [Trapa incisa]